MTDQAALWSAALAAVITLSLGDGRYDWLSFALGVALALQIAAFYRPAPPEPYSRWDRCTTAGGFGAVSGLVAAMILAWPVQIVVGTPRGCRRSEVDLDDCAGAAAYPWLGVVWLTAAVAMTCWHWTTVVCRPTPPPS
ncbi:hypothetical protein OG562_44250 [Streptomyces sp. NBC_01275]|uniref:hypothetical protein n=1 Tax=Streptomyces sp. NBC_01275 TaxID=2903807 RepID=UPI0022590D85|nr:hypothetical protein [Streptomyces sp. NBC_01275]MCX4767847.1 hypothetical protein [Streptomyces sp. NBC_01275]